MVIIIIIISGIAINRKAGLFVMGMTIDDPGEVQRKSRKKIKRKKISNLKKISKKIYSTFSEINNQKPLLAK